MTVIGKVFEREMNVITILKHINFITFLMEMKWKQIMSAISGIATFKSLLMSFSF